MIQGSLFCIHVLLHKSNTIIMGRLLKKAVTMKAMPFDRVCQIEYEKNVLTKKQIVLYKSRHKCYFKNRERSY